MNHQLMYVAKVRLLKTEDKSGLCAAIESTPELEQTYFITVFNPTLNFVVAKIRHLNSCVKDFFHIKSKDILVTACEETISFWAMSHTPHSKEPKIYTIPQASIELEDCFFKATQPSFLNVDPLEAEVAVVKSLSQVGTGILYACFFFLLDRPLDGYNHKITFEVDSLIEHLAYSGDGSCFVLRTAKKAIHLIDVFNGASLNNSLSPAILNREWKLALSSLSGKHLLLCTPALNS